MTRRWSRCSASATVDDGVRPDVVLTLAGRGKLVIDAKFPLDEFQRAAGAQGEQERRRALAAHAKAVAGHVSVLARRDYPAKIKEAIDFTVCFVPADDLLSAAYAERPDLFYQAVRQRVLIATPTASSCRSCTSWTTSASWCPGPVCRILRPRKPALSRPRLPPAW